MLEAGVEPIPILCRNGRCLHSCSARWCIFRSRSVGHRGKVASQLESWSLLMIASDFYDHLSIAGIIRWTVRPSPKRADDDRGIGPSRPDAAATTFAGSIAWANAPRIIDPAGGHHPARACRRGRYLQRQLYTSGRFVGAERLATFHDRIDPEFGARVARVQESRRRFRGMFAFAIVDWGRRGGSSSRATLRYQATGLLRRLHPAVLRIRRKRCGVLTMSRATRSGALDHTGPPYVPAPSRLRRHP